MALPLIAALAAWLALSGPAAAVPAGKGAPAAATPGGSNAPVAASTPEGPGAPAAPISIPPVPPAPGERRPGHPMRVPGALPGSLLDLDSVRLAVMEPNGVFAGDLDLMPTAGKRDRFRLSRVETVLRNPFRLEGVVDEALARTEPYALADKPLPVPPEHLWPLLDAEPGAWPEQLPGLPGSPDSALGRISGGLADHMAGLGPSEREFLFREASSLFLADEQDTTLNPIQAEMKRLKEDARAFRILALAGRLQRPGLVRAASAAWGLEAWILDSLRVPGASEKRGPGSFLARLEALAERAKVPLEISGTGPDRHEPDRGIWIDLGGDDQWDLSPRGRPGEFLLIVDLEGDDLYRARDSLSRSPGNLGVSLLADLAGNDHYIGSNFAFGSALFGYSHLFDASGHDYYEGRCASLGFAAFGIGAVQDESGSDTYSASLLSQGASGTWGLGLLLDRAGDDRYLARPTFQDDLRYADHHIHMVQGFSTGLAPDYSGGVGILRDQRGNDAYLADIFGQGSAYWYALGLLLDESGDDRYQAHQYAQGAGVHIAVGAAVDWAGNDQRSSKGVSQGCGHDLGFGLLHDRAGDDAYLGTDKVQGSGSANGLGVLHDEAGKDVYTSLNPAMALGDADMRRDRGSFGFFLDGGGKDAYSRREDGAVRDEGAGWRVFDGKVKGNGYGLDLADAGKAGQGSLQVTAAGAGAAASAAATAPVGSSQPAPPVAAAAEKGREPRPLSAPATRPGADPGAHLPVFDFRPPALTRQDSLFIIAATGEPRFQSLRDSAEKRLREAGPATLEYLAARRLTGQTPRQRHYVERLFTLISDSGRGGREPVRILEAALRKAPDSVRTQLLRIGSALGDTAFLPVARAWLRADSVEVRRMALRSLGTYPKPADLPLLMEGMDSTGGLERQMRLWALSQHRPLKDWRALVPLLRDERQYNRQLARRILARSVGGEWHPLAPLAPSLSAADTTRADERLEWALLALEMPGDASRKYLAKALPLLDPAQRRFFRSSLSGSAGKSP